MGIARLRPGRSMSVASGSYFLIRVMQLSSSSDMPMHAGIDVWSSSHSEFSGPVSVIRRNYKPMPT
jgi:hypothetical protein